MNMSMRKEMFFVTTSKAKMILSSVSVVLPRLTRRLLNFRDFERLKARSLCQSEMLFLWFK